MSVEGIAPAKPWAADDLTKVSDDHRTQLQQHLMLDPKPREEMNSLVMDAMQKTGPRYWIVVAVLALIMIVGLFGAWAYQIMNGMGVAGIQRPVYWGMYITNLVFWIGISHSGTFVSAVLRVFKVEWRRPIVRASEMMTTFALIVAGMYPLIHLGRVWRVYWMIPYPNQRQLWPNFHSPLVWDMLAIMTYLTGSTLYLYLPLLPDLAMARDRTTGWRHLLYRTLALGWRGTEREWHHLRTALNIFAFAIIPVMFSVHTIVSWDFGLTMKVGWHSSIFGPYFIVGAIFSGVSAVATVLIVVRKTMDLDYFLRDEHFDALGKLILLFSFAWTYFFFADFLTEWYGGEEVGHAIVTLQARGPVAPLWYIMLFTCIVIPWLTLWSRRVRVSPIGLLLVTLAINVGMYIERYIIVTGFLSRNRSPFNWGAYNPSLVEISITIGSLATFILLYALASRLIPLIPVWEVQEGQIAHSVRRMGRQLVPSISELE